MLAKVSGDFFMDIVSQAWVENSSEYLRELFNNLSAIYNRTTEGVLRMFFGTEYLPEKNLGRPLSKLKRDILIQIGLLDNKGEFIE